jgi:hypothetical protein
MAAMGIDDAMIQRWVRTGYLFRVLPGVYAVGHLASSHDAALFSAVLCAGPGAGLDGLTAGVWRGIVKWRKPIAIEVASPRRFRSLAPDAAGNTLASGSRSVTGRPWSASRTTGSRSCRSRTSCAGSRRRAI